jgi:hypothetical protein
MSEESTKAIAGRYFEERSSRSSCDSVGELPTGAESHRAWPGSLHAAFSEHRVTLGDPVAEGDRVVLPWSVTGVLAQDHQGAGSPGEDVQFSGLAMLTIVDGEIVDDIAFSEGFGSVLLGQSYRPAAAASSTTRQNSTPDPLDLAGYE